MNAIWVQQCEAFSLGDDSLSSRLQHKRPVLSIVESPKTLLDPYLFDEQLIMWRSLIASKSKIRPSLALGLAMLTPTTVSLCEDNKNNNLWDTVLPKNSDGSIGWDKVSQQVGEGVYWDKLARQAGHQVSPGFDSVPSWTNAGLTQQHW